jgi:hypothetical protein
MNLSIAKPYRISQTFAPYYSPQANPTERVNRVIKTTISSYVVKHHKDWDIYLRESAYALNTSVHSATGYTPAYLNLGRELKQPSMLDAPEGLQELDHTLPQKWVKKISTLQDVYIWVRDNLEGAYEKASRQYNLLHRDSVFKAGDLILRKNYVLSSATDKVAAGLSLKYLDPYRVKMQISDVRYELQVGQTKLGSF